MREESITIISIAIIIIILIISVATCSVKQRFISTEDVKVCGLSCRNGMHELTVDKCVCK